MKKYLFLILFLIAISQSFAEENTQRHSLSLNIGGPQSNGYFEYQYLISESPQGNVSFSFGAGMLSNQFTLPIGLVYTFGQKNQFLLGFHYVPYIRSNYMIFFESFWPPPIITEYNYNSASLRLGYRKNFKIQNENLFIQAFLSPVISFENDATRIYPGIGMGLGTSL